MTYYLAMDITTNNEWWIHFNEATLADKYFLRFLAYSMKFFLSNLQLILHF